MDAATIIVLVLSAGVIALLAWFEINSRRNEANLQSKSTPAQSDTPTLKKKSQSAVEPDTQKIKPA
jgi:hypothetical protein